MGEEEPNLDTKHADHTSDPPHAASVLLLTGRPGSGKTTALRMVAAAAVNTPVLCRVRRRITAHGAEDVDAPARWLEWFASDQGCSFGAM